ncbi:hypothetical protein [Pseudomonas aeruginosa]|uniref:hypothetical protein n=1 Tax=Pseudomonas aeruginosa TaxID=287 RepID=UPI0032B4E0C8|nr:hypothetical protein [Pseudomonas aeruginosa]
MEFASIVASIVSGAVGAAAISWLLRTWIAERLKQSISYEYFQKLESYKTELNSKLQVMHHEHQVSQIRTSLFFDYQREAFAGIIGLVRKVNEAWVNASYVEYHGPADAVPSGAYRELKEYYEQNQLFLDEECTLAVELVLEYYSDSFPFDDGTGQLHERDTTTAYNNVEELRPILAALFRSKIGVLDNGDARKTLLGVGALRLTNSLRIYNKNIPPKAPLKIDNTGSVELLMKTARNHETELVEYLGYFCSALSEEGSFQDYYRKALSYERLLRAS